ncbi:MAG: hypothetical protein HYV14_08360 [Elusimicrobia bacterium]|nr:hypothetical protein [Elusimicrobiota bacterium]
MIHLFFLIATIALSRPAAAQDKPAVPQDLQETVQQLQRQLNQQQEELRELQKALPPKAAPPAAGADRKPARLGFFIDVEPQWISALGLEREYAARNNTAVCPDPGGGGGRCLSASGAWSTVGTQDVFAPKVTAGFILPSGDIFSVGGFHAQSLGGRSRLASGNVFGAAPLEPFDEITNPNGNNQPLPLSADAENTFAMDQVDFEYRRPLRFESLELTPELGLRSFFLKNELKTTFNHAVPGFSFSLARGSRSAAIGPKAGLGAERRIAGPVSLRAKGVSGFLIGYNESEQVLCQGTSFANPGCGSLHSFRRRVDQGFPFIEGEFAVQYKARPSGGFSAAAGYRIASYFGLVTLPETIGDSLDIGGSGNSSLQRDIFQRHDVAISSFFFRLQYLF